MATDYSEILMQSMDLVIKQRLSELQFDKTINCQITNTSAAHKGEYEVTDGATTFTAYSRDVTYKTGDSVYVTIPNGDFDNQKQIIGKYVGPGESVNYLSPLDSYVDITGDLCKDVDSSTAFLLANKRDVVDKNGKVFENNTKKVIWEAEIQNGKGFERLGLKADFKTWLKQLKTVNGNYGLCLYVTYVDKTNVNTEDSVKVASFRLDSDDMYGNPYNFNTFFTQEKVFDISHITGQITYMALVFYQDYNFTDASGMEVPHYETKINPESGEETREYFMPNIYVENIHISMGYDIGKFNEDTILLYCLNEPTYNYNNLTQQNRKTLQVRWVRVTDEGIYSVDSEKEIPENAAIHWYKYQVKVQDEVDELAGPMWFEIEEGLNKLQISVDPDTKELTQLYKVIVELPSKQWIEAKLDPELNEDYQNLKYLAEEGQDIASALTSLETYENEIRSQRKIYSSEVIEFKSEVPVVDKMTADLINGLKIEIDEKGYKGNYMLYNPSNKITNINEATKMRAMRATYKSLVTGEETLDGAESIIWKIPLTSTMIYPPEDGREYDSKDSATSYWAEQGFAYIKRMSGNSNSGGMGTVNDWSCEQKFRIKDYYQESFTNNIVYCYVVKNNIAYEASAEMFFGPKGSNGTDFTFKMYFDHDTIGVTAHTEQELKDKKDQIIKVNLAMYDFYNEKVPNFWDRGVDISWYHQDENKILSFCDRDGNVINKPTIDSNKCFYIKYPKQETRIPNAAILQAQVHVDPTVSGEATELKNVKITAYLPVPYRSRKTLTGITGATKIMYDSTGTNPEYDKIAYSLLETEEKSEPHTVQDIDWKIISPEYTTTGIVEVIETYYTSNSENATEQSKKVAKNKKPNYFPMMNGTEIIVPGMYTELDGNNDRNIYVTATDINTKEILWSQPIMMFRDAFSSPMLNAWDGSLTIDKNSGTILSTMIGAGKKDEENRFNGVLMGDVKDAISNIITLGLYGFNQGVQSFGWKVDGTGFIGKSGQGQILFDGNRGTISSGIWKNSNKKIGMEIDLDGPSNPGSDDNWSSTGSSLKMYGAAGKIDIDTSKSSTNLFNIQGRINPRRADGTLITNPNSFKYQDLIKISIDVDSAYSNIGTDEVSADTSFFIQSLGYSAGGDKPTGTRLDLQNGYFYSFGEYGRVQFAPSKTTFFRLADKDNNVLFVIKANNSDADGDPGAQGDGAVSSSSVNTISQYYLQSSDFNAGGKIGTRLDLQNGKYTSYGSAGYVIINSNHDGLFRVGALSEGYWNLMYVGSNNYYLQSLQWAKTSGTSKLGSKWDLNDGSFKAYGSGGKISIQPNNPSALFVVQTAANKTIMNVGSGAYFLQSADYVENGNTGFKLNLANGTMVGANFFIKLTKDPNYSLQIGEQNNENAIQILQGNAQRFAVKWDGSVYLNGKATLTVESGKIQSGGETVGKYYSLDEKGGTIGPWHFSDTAFWAGGETEEKATTVLHPDGTLKMQSESLTLKLTDYAFSLEATEEIYPKILLNKSMLNISISNTQHLQIGTVEDDAGGDLIETKTVSLRNGGSSFTMGNNSASLSPSNGGTLYVSNDHCFLGISGDHATGNSACLYVKSNLAKIRSESGEVRLETGGTSLTLTSEKCVIDAPTIIIGGATGRDLVSDLNNLSSIIEAIESWKNNFGSGSSTGSGTTGSSSTT